jgi:hypothetical protein
MLNMQLSRLVPAIIVLLTLLTGVITGGVSIFVSESALQKSINDKLHALAETRKQGLKNYLHAIEQDLELWSKVVFGIRIKRRPDRRQLPRHHL